MVKIPAAQKLRQPRQKEVTLHMSAAAFLRHAWPADLPFFHVPNGEQRDARTGAKLKAMGALAGVPDFALHLPRGQIAYIELKTSAGAMSDAQFAFRQACIAHGHGHAVCRSVEDVETTITRWLAAFGLEPRARLQRKAA
ncbi:MAG: hypothetical protein JWQ97_963 [Phenylobacterium sp.]|nr:hypothetical protein [Phenylobacterium sp.]